jgi:hypothetical protein
MVTVVNRTPVPLNVRFDGQDTVLPPGESPLPKVAVGYAKNQNPIMGSADPNNPSLSGARYLLGVKGTPDECTPLSQGEWNDHCDAACRMDWKVLTEDTVKPGEHIVVKGKKGGVQAKSSFDPGVRHRGTANMNVEADV